MKIRNGFVSNSSSSSFIIWRENLTVAQEALIENYVKIAKELPQDTKGYSSEYGYPNSCMGWDIEKSDDKYFFYTTMDNFNLKYFFDDLGIKYENRNF